MITPTIVTVRDAIHTLHAQVHPSRADYLVAALSDDPETIDDLRAALGRFVHAPEAEQFFGNWLPGVYAGPIAKGLFVIDLAARLLVAPPNDDVTWNRAGILISGRDDEELLVPYRLADEWEVRLDPAGWEARAAERRRERGVVVPLDARPILYGRVCEFIFQECAVAVMAGAKMCSEESDGYAAISELHARWLTTPRDDLHGLAPRDVLLCGKDHLSWQLQDRSEHWSITGAPPPPLPKGSSAYRFGGFGTHEIVLYYDLVRILAKSCWDYLVAHSNRTADLTDVVRELEALRDEWLNTPEYMDLHGRTPASVIERERQRMPEAMTGAEAVVDHDCPMCQMMADLPGPMFWHLDGCNMDEGFAFSFHRTREEWEAEQREYEEMDRRIAERRTGELPMSNSPWRTSYSTELDSEPPVLALYRFAAHLTELTQDLKSAIADQPLIDDLNRSFGNLREVSDPPNLDLVEPVVERLLEALAAIASACPNLEEKATDLERQVRAFHRRLSDPPREDVPF